MHIARIDPQSDVALSLLRKAALEIQPLYGASAGPPWPQNQPLGLRDVYVVGFVGDQAVACGAIREVDSGTCEAHRIYVLRTHGRRDCVRFRRISRSMLLGYAIAVCALRQGIGKLQRSNG